jgi:uncharacterized protein (UPF0264 family)
MTQLLISVRSLAEARDVLATDGVDLLDVKQPSLGSLGRADCDVVRTVVGEAAGRVPVSAACGELMDVGAHSAAQSDGWEGTQFFKFGLAGAANATDWPERWSQAIRSVRESSGKKPPLPVAVVYADWRNVDAPEPQEVIEVGASLGCGAALLDTCGKSQGRVTDIWTPDEIAAFVRHAHRRDMLAVVGGSLSIHTIPLIIGLQADVVAIRGAACRADRTSQVDPAQVRRLIACLRDCPGESVG